MSEKQPISLGDALQHFLHQKQIQTSSNYQKAALLAAWEAITGNYIAQQTQAIYLQHGILQVQIASSVLRNELLMARHDLKNRLNMYWQEERVKELRIH